MIPIEGFVESRGEQSVQGTYTSLVVQLQRAMHSERYPTLAEAAMDVFFQDVFSRDAIIALLGSACPQSVQPIAELVHRWNISEVCQTKAYLCVSESFRIFL